MFRQRIRISFTKEGLAKFLGHHDLMRVFERALRRSGLPLAFSAGFNPRPQVSFPVALPLGFESQCEIMEFELDKWVSTRRVACTLAEHLPEGIGIVSAESVGHANKAEVVGTIFRVEMAAPPGDFETRLDAFMESGEVLVERVTKSGAKTLNVRDYVTGARLDGEALILDLAVKRNGSIRPREVLQVLLDCPQETLPPMRIIRTRLDFAAPPQK